MSKIKKAYACSFLLANDLIGGKWKQRILWHIMKGDNRFSLLQKAMPDITHKVLISQLKEMQESGLIIRKDFNTLPLRVEYSISQKYQTLIPMLEKIGEFTKVYAKEHQIDIPE